MVGSPCRFAGLGSAPNPPPLPISATIDEITGIWSITFDRPLTPAALAIANWTIRAANTFFNVTAASSSGLIVSGSSDTGDEDLGPDVISYAAAPADVISTRGIPAAAFADFPITVT